MSEPTSAEIIASLRQQLATCQQLGIKPVSKQKAKGALYQNDKKGAFKRKNAVFTNVVKEGGDFPPESGRYVLYVSYACPWASRCLALLHMKNLTPHIEICSVYPTWGRTHENSDDIHAGWVFVDPEDKKLNVTNTAGYGEYGLVEYLTKDTVFGKKTVRDIYEMQDQDTHTYSVPIFVDKKTKKIVCNESSIIVEFLNRAFNKLPGVNASLDLSPPHLKEKQEEVNSWIYHDINNGVYKCGFAKSQEAYQEAFFALYDSLDKLEDHLSKNRYLCGNKLSMADIRLFVTLIRFDEVYVVYFKCNGKLIREYPNILGYTREIYQIPGVKESVSFTHIKNHYYTSHPTHNLYGVIPIGPRGLKANRKDPKAIENFYLKPHGRGCNKMKKLSGFFIFAAGIAAAIVMLKKRA